ncbi:hypothetical protein [Mesorhizobium sp. M0047]|uniref:hypothetical protein n=1 Tax=Mesorhizobium sp. M0047 TaxID=2956859 RepID=UPI00333924F5
MDRIGGPIRRGVRRCVKLYQIGLEGNAEGRGHASLLARQSEVRVGGPEIPKTLACSRRRQTGNVGQRCGLGEAKPAKLGFNVAKNPRRRERLQVQAFDEIFDKIDLYRGERYSRQEHDKEQAGKAQETRSNGFGKHPD